VELPTRLRSDEDEVRVLVVDDHDLFRHGLRELLQAQGVRVVGEASDGDEAVRLALHVMPDVVVMDLHMPLVSGVEATRRLTAIAPTVRVLILTISANDADVMSAIVAGASGYLLKDASVTEIAAGVRAAARGEALVSPQIASYLLRRLRPQHGGVPEVEQLDLTEREMDVLKLIAQGKENAEIAEELVISIRTVKNHVSSILAKLQLGNRIEAAVYAVRQGIA
jgi:NarL family two-component system response regulator LiaR